jgi:hypothetical protein
MRQPASEREWTHAWPERHVSQRLASPANRVIDASTLEPASYTLPILHSIHLLLCTGNPSECNHITVKPSKQHDHQ